MPNFGKGGKKAEEIVQQQSNFAKVKWLDIADKETIILRLLDDSEDWLYAQQHNFVPTKGAPEGASSEESSKYPTRMSAVCRMDDGFLNPDTNEREHADCFICDHMSKDDGKPYTRALRLWSRAVVREPVIGTQEHVDAGKIEAKKIGAVVGYTDKMVEKPILDDDKKPTGKVEMQREILVLRQGMKNFYGYLQGAADVYGGLLDRDWSVTRKGTGTATDYSIMPLNPTQGFDLADPATKERYEGYAKQVGIDLPDLIAKQASDDFYGYFFDTRVKAEARRKKDGDSNKGESGAPAAQQEKPKDPEVSAEAVAAMKARVMGDQAARTEDTSFV